MEIKEHRKWKSYNIGNENNNNTTWKTNHMVENLSHIQEDMPDQDTLKPVPCFTNGW